MFVMTYTIQIICSEQGGPKKIVEVNEEKLVKNPGPIDNMNDAFLTRFSPFRVFLPKKLRPTSVKRRVVVNGIIELALD